MRQRSKTALLTLVFVAVSAAGIRAQHRVTTPQEQFGHEIGADYELVTYRQLHDYWIKLARESDRMVLDTIGLTSEGRPQIMAIISAPENIARLDHYRQVASRLAHATDVDEREARSLAAEGRAVIWIDGGLHATEVLGAQQLTELVYQMNDRTDPETERILRDVILLAVHANPDGHALVADWYLRQADPKKRSLAGLPVLYNKYAGHDNNRDFYMSALAETTNMNRVMYREWYPQIVYNHHQTGPAGTVMFSPPFRDPPNYYFAPQVLTGLERVGGAMHDRFLREGKGGVTTRSGASYSTWWNGGLRTTPYFHNMIGLLTETIGNPTPMEVPFLPRKQLERNDLPLPVEPGEWHFRRSIDYSITADRAVLDYASRNRDQLLYNLWRMGRDEIEWGSHDHWTNLPKEIDAAAKEVNRGTRAQWQSLLRDPADRDPRGFIIPSDQRDFLTATKFVNALLKNGVEVLRATSDFEVAGTRYPAGSYVVRTAQAFRAHVLDMFEPQNHPNDFAYPGGPPIAPYDNTGWTLAWQMGVSFDRILDGFVGPFVRITDDTISPPPGRIVGSANPAGYLVDHINDAFVAVNRVLKRGGSVSWYTEPVSAGVASLPAGVFYIRNGRGIRDVLEKLATEKGLTFYGAVAPPAGHSMALHPIKVGLWDRYGGSMPSGWTRMLLEAFEFDFDVLYPPDLDHADLSKYDVLVFEDGAIPAREGARGGFRGRFGQFDTASVPEKYRRRMGRVTIGTTVPRILDYVRGGGTVVAIGTSTSLAYHAGLPLRDHLTENGKPLPREKYFTPGSILDMKVEHVTPLAGGLGPGGNGLFSHSPTFELEPNAEEAGVHVVGWYDTDAPLKSGWAWGQQYLKDGIGAVDADYGKGKIFLFGPKITFRAQPHGTLPFLFNGIYYGAAHGRPVRER